MLPIVAIAKMPLPKYWPRRVRSAVVHAIALARTFLTHACSVAASSITPAWQPPGQLPRRDDLYRGRALTCWINEPRHGARGRLCRTPIHRVADPVLISSQRAPPVAQG